MKMSKIHFASKISNKSLDHNNDQYICNVLNQIKLCKLKCIIKLFKGGKRCYFRHLLYSIR